MNPKLSVTVQVDLGGLHLTLAVTGTLTKANQQALPPLVERARTAFPAAALTVDLHQVDLAEAAAIDLLAHRLQDTHLGPDPSGNGTVRITAPACSDQDTASRWREGPSTARSPRRKTSRTSHPSPGAAVPRRHPHPASAGGPR